MSRGRREGIEDLWTTSSGDRSKRYGRGKRWRVRWVVEGREHTQAFHRKVDAQRCLQDVTTSISSGRIVDGRAGRTVIAELFAQWSAQSPHIAPKTAESRESVWRKHVGPRWSAVPASEVRVTAVRAWVAQMVSQGVGVPTIERAVGVLRGVLDVAVDDRRIAANPVVSVKVPRRTHAARGYLTLAQVDALVAATTFRPEVPLFLALTGLRWGEMAALRLSDIDMLRRRINVSRSVVEVNGGLSWGTPKDSERRSVPFPKALGEVLSTVMSGNGRDGLLFTADGGAVLRVSNYRRRVFDKAVALCQADDPVFPRISPHDLRHTAASLAVSAGASVLAVQRMLGHAKASMTLDVYADLFDDDLDSVGEALDRRITASREAAAYPLRTGTGSTLT